MKEVLIYGLGVSGKGAEKLLKKQKIKYYIYDDKQSTKENKKYVYENIKKFDTMIKSPGIPFDNELVMYAKENKVAIIDEIELAARFSNYKIIAITGTNGKTTTTTKIKELLEYAGYKAEYCGNIGRSFAEVVALEIEADFIVLELSSYQLEAINEFKPYISIVINLTPDHLNRYKTLDEYYDSKFNIMKNQNENDYTLINIDDKEILKEKN